MNYSPSSAPKFRTFLNTTTAGTSTGPSSTIIVPIALVNALPVALLLSTIVILCIFGNILVILSVFTFRPLRTVQNFFIVSLAFSDVLVAIIVMPFHIVTHILKRWIFGQVFCQIFVTSDVLLCTSSILNLCAIAVRFHLSLSLVWSFICLCLAWSILGNQWSDSIRSSTNYSTCTRHDHHRLVTFGNHLHSSHHRHHTQFRWIEKFQ